MLKKKQKYSRTSVAQPLLLIYPASWVFMISYTRLLWSNFCICFPVVIFIFKNENNNRKTLTAEASYTVHIYTRVPRVQIINTETYPGWLELPLTGTIFHAPSSVRVTEVLLYKSKYLVLSV